MDKKKTEEQLREERRHELIFPTLAAGYMRGYVARNGRMTAEDEDGEKISNGREGAKNFAESILAEVMEGQGMLRSPQSLRECGRRLRSPPVRGAQ